MGLPPQNHMFLESRMERPGPGLKRAGFGASASPVPPKKGASSPTPNANGHLPETPSS